MPKIYHPKRGFVITTDQALIDEILAEGGQVVLKNREIDQPLDDLIRQEPVEETPEPLISEPVKEREMPEPLPAVIKHKHRSKLK